MVPIKMLARNSTGTLIIFVYNYTNLNATATQENTVGAYLLNHRQNVHPFLNSLLNKIKKYRERVTAPYFET